MFLHTGDGQVYKISHRGCLCDACLQAVLATRSTASGARG
jgi:hypothetical protein